MKLTFAAIDVLGSSLDGVVLSVTSLPVGGSQLVNLPAAVILPDTVTSIELQGTHATMMQWTAKLLRVASGPRWRTTDPTMKIVETQNGADAVLTFGRIRFAPTIAYNENQRVPFALGKTLPLDFNPGGTLVFVDPSNQLYRDVWLNKEQVRTLMYPGTGDPNGPSWERFRTRPPAAIDLRARGSFVLLEYGDPTSVPNGLRFLISVWAPQKFSGPSPFTVVQFTPNPDRSLGYPLDGANFGRVYPYALTLNRAPTSAELATKSLKFSDLRQPYCDLAANRTVNRYKTIYQLYAACPGKFVAETGEGPVLITPIPVGLNTKTYYQRAPFDSRQGLARLVREVLHFLMASGLTGYSAGSKSQLRFRPPATEVVVLPNGSTLPLGPPSGRAQITVMVHSAAFLAALPLVPRGGTISMPASFPAVTWAASEADFWQDWIGLWVIDGVGQPNRIGTPTIDSNVARTLLAWAGSGADQRRLVAVYASSGIANDAVNGLVKNPTRKNGTASFVEEGRNSNSPRVTWLRMTDSYISPMSKVDSTWPTFGYGNDPHNFIYDIGIGYAAACTAQ